MPFGDPWRGAAEVPAPLPEKHGDPARMRPQDPKEGGDSGERPGLPAKANHPSHSLARTSPLDGDPGAADQPDSGPRAASDRPVPRRTPWAELLQRVFEVDALRCPRCGAQMRLLAAIDDPEVACKILGCLGLPARGPPLAAAPGASVDSAHESWDEDPSWDFDQTPPGD